jgi:hypothetical protein
MALLMLVLRSSGLQAQTPPEAPASQTRTTVDLTGADPASLPRWLQMRIAGFGRSSAQATPLSIWAVRYKGEPAYLFFATCCDQFNQLYDKSGQNVCAPSGGFTGSGDGRCTEPLEPTNGQRLVWPYAPAPRASSPR